MHYHETFKCQECGKVAFKKGMGRREPKFCSNACRQRAHRRSVKDDGIAPARKERVTNVDDIRNAPDTSGVDGRVFVRVRNP